MNTIRSTWVGWGVLCVAGGGAYYFAKQSINADRTSRYEAEVKRKAQLKAMETEYRQQAMMIAPNPNLSDDSRLKGANRTRFQNADHVTSPTVVKRPGNDPGPGRA